MSTVQILCYLGLLTCVLGVVYKIIRLATMPMHLRWDLYPIPHEKTKHKHGGSYYEEVDWWIKPSEMSRLSEWKEMAREIFFIQTLYRNNRSLWWFSFPFHLGLYLCIGFLASLGLTAVLGMRDIAVTATSSSGLIVTLYGVGIALGIGGPCLGLFGSVGLLASRAFRYDLRATSVWTDYLNLLLLAAVFATGLVCWATIDSYSAVASAFVTSLMTFSAPAHLPALASAHYALTALFLLWLPFTHMTHFVGKYFTYHQVRWEDHPNAKGSDLERAVNDALGYRIRWAAPHIKSDGNWGEAASGDDNQKDHTGE
jgi:nitrate reductase gamma subunit